MNLLVFMTYMSYLICTVFIAMGIPLALDKVAPNHWYGFRTQRTLESVEVWYSVNNIGGKSFIVAGIISAIIVFMLQRYWSADLSVKAYVIFSIPIVLGLAGIVYAFKVG
ncbi:SdpI family protein [Kordiimonas aquimaris]|uniref:SdpI family protein n=1 Tax=Kordiimonas aquimaris TaxID=707591 RepID=UPI0021D0D12E|nr:SdpI family protein [Kordiimonas aquimaris]